MYWTDLAELRLSDLTHFSISAFQQIFVVGLTPHLWLFHKNKNIQSKVSSTPLIHTFGLFDEHANHFRLPFCVEHMGNVRMQISASTMWEMAGRVQFVNTLTLSWHIFLAYLAYFLGTFLAYPGIFLAYSGKYFWHIWHIFLAYITLDPQPTCCLEK